MINQRNCNRYVVYILIVLAFLKIMEHVVKEMSRSAITNNKDDNDDLHIMINDLSATLKKDKELMTGLRDELDELRAFQRHSQNDLGVDADLLRTQQKTILQRQEKLQMILDGLENLRKDHDMESALGRQERAYSQQKLFDLIKSQQVGNNEDFDDHEESLPDNDDYNGDYMKSQFIRINKDSEEFADKVKSQLDVFRNMEHHIIQHDKPLLFAHLHHENDDALRREMEAGRFQAIQERMEKLEEKKRKNDNDLEDLDHKAMNNVHLRTYNKLTEAELKMYYNREMISHRKFGTKVLDIHNDRAKLMDLFPNAHDTENDRVSDQIRVRLNVHETKTILIHESKSKLHDTINLEQCNVDKCRFTSSWSDLKGADAIYMENQHHLENIDNDLMFMKINSAIKPKITISFQIESPQAVPQLITASTKVKLNWTASYRTDSVLNTPYERFTPFLNATGLVKHPGQNYAEGKTKMAAWFVSNCNAGNKRNNYVDELEKYINVDVYGLCGIPCPKNDNNGEKNCLNQLDTDYKFYLAFENSNCKDYVTEKVYTALK